jgi:hypothetical protein
LADTEENYLTPAERTEAERKRRKVYKRKPTVINGLIPV